MRLVHLLCVLIVVCGLARAQGQPVALTQNATPAAVSAAREDSRRLKEPPLQRAVEAIDRVLIVSIDGLRPDVLLRAQAPNVRSLLAKGSYTFWAETTPEAYTLPCHVSMLTGVSAERHGVTWNEYIEQSYPNVPTLFEIARQAGYSTVMATGKMKFIVFTRPGALDDYYYPQEEPVSDDEVALHAAALLRKHRPHVMFVHFPGVDTVGHDFGWGSAEQIAAVEKADGALGRVLEALASLKLDDSTLVILTADHGGAAKSHEMHDPRSRFIPWIAAGPGVRQGFDLTLLGDRTVRIEDTFSTACAFLGLEPGDDYQGKPVLEVLETTSPAR
ncbi:MAG TPA: ectonucleotide pyrophosphatase/phosphodiesterase [Lacipirellulaceae bacterium]